MTLGSELKEHTLDSINLRIKQDCFATLNDYVDINVYVLDLGFKLKSFDSVNVSYPGDIQRDMERFIAVRGSVKEAVFSELKRLGYGVVEDKPKEFLVYLFVDGVKHGLTYVNLDRNEMDILHFFQNN